MSVVRGSFPNNFTKSEKTVNSERRKKFCPECGDRVSRSAYRCYHCGRTLKMSSVILAWLLVATVLFSLVFLLANFFLG